MTPSPRMLVGCLAAATALALAATGLVEAPGPAPLAQRTGLRPVASAATPPTEARARTERSLPRATAVPALRALGAPPVAPPVRATASAKLTEATDKLLDKLAAKIAKAEAKGEKLAAKQLAKEEALAETEAAKAEVQVDYDIVEGLLALAEQELADALAMPSGTPEENAARNAAIALAQAGVNLAEKELAKIAKVLLKFQKSIDKQQASIDKLQDKQDANDADIAGWEQETLLLLAPFDFEASSNVALDVRIEEIGGSPIEGARLVITAPLLAPKGKKPIEKTLTAPVFWEGFSDGGGDVETTIRLPDNVEEVDLVVVAPGYGGDYTEPELRDGWGPCAPAARITLPRALLDGAVVSLTPILESL